MRIWSASGAGPLRSAEAPATVALDEIGKVNGTLTPGAALSSAADCAFYRMPLRFEISARFGLAGAFG